MTQRPRLAGVVTSRNRTNSAQCPCFCRAELYCADPERAESMRKPTRFGVYGLVAWTCSFCLSAATTLPQEARIASTNNLATEDLSPSALSAPALQQLQEQNLAVLKAIEQLREDKEAALNRYTESISAQLNILKDAIIFQREQEMASARSSNRFIFTVAAVIGALAVLVMLVTALVPVWAVKRLAAAR